MTDVADSSPTRVTVTAPDGTERELTPGMRVTFGRGRAADIRVLPEERSLSRIAGEIIVESAGVRVVNLSRTHSLKVVTDTGDSSTLAQAREGMSTASVVVSSGTAAVGSAGMHRSGQTVRITVPGRWDGADRPLRPSPVEEPSTVGPDGLDPNTKYFVVALALCRDRLENPGQGGTNPTAKEITLRALKMVHAWHLVRAIESGDDAVQARFTQQIQEHLKYLKERVEGTGQLPRGTRITKPVLEAALVDLGIVRPEHLELLEDPDWLAHQEQLWWGDDEGRRRTRRAAGG